MRAYEKINPGGIRFGVGAIALVLAVVVAAAVLTSDPPKDDLQARARAARLAKDEFELVRIFEARLAGDRHNVKYHYEFVHAVGELPRIHNNKYDYDGHPDPKEDQVRKHYEEWSKSKNAFERDLGFYCLGLMLSRADKFDEALKSFDQVANRDLKYLNNSAGYAHLHRKPQEGETFRERDALAEKCFRREIALDGNIAGACNNLIGLLVKEKRFGEIGTIAADPRLKPFVPAQALRIVHIYKREWFGYFKALPSVTMTHFNLIAFIGALAGAFVWYHYFRRVDIFEPEKHRYLLLTFAGGALGGFIATFFYDVLDYHGWELPNTWNGDLAYCIFKIGLVEELAKLIPFLMVVWLTRECNEPIDYIVYASMSALGFATAENLMYIDSYGSRLIVARSMISATLHMCDTSFIAYGLVLARYRKWGRDGLNIALFFMVAVVAHGLFDYPLISKALNPALAMLVLPVMMIYFTAYGYMISNAQSQSCFFDEKRSHQFARLGTILAYSVLGVVCLEYFLLSVQAGPTMGRKAGLKMLIFTLPLVFLFCRILTRFSISKGGWVGIGGNCEVPDGNGGEKLVVEHKATARAKIEPIDPETEGAILTRRMWLKIWGTLLVILAVFLAFPVFVLIAAYLNSVASLGIYLILFFAVLIGCAVHLDRRSRKFILKESAEQIVARRERKLVNPADTNAVFVEVVPRQKWTSWKPDPASDVGFLSVKAEETLLFEGGRERWTIPLDSIISVSVAPNRAIKKPSAIYCVLKCRVADGEYEIPLRLRLSDNDANTTKPKIAEGDRAKQLLDFILKVFPRADDLQRKAEKTMVSVELEFYSG